MHGEIRVVEDVPATFVDEVEDSYLNKTKDRFSITLSGGSSAPPCYTALSHSNQINWRDVDMFFSDERCVPITDERSNAGQAMKIFLGALKPKPNIFALSCADAPGAYEFLVRTYGGLDVVHLGVGSDGHTASLFPNSKALLVEDRYVVSNEDPTGANHLKRLTLTYAGIATARKVIITVIGADKAEVMANIKTDKDLPAAHIHGPDVIWLVDPAAADKL